MCCDSGKIRINLGWHFKCFYNKNDLKTSILIIFSYKREMIEREYIFFFNGEELNNL